MILHEETTEDTRKESSALDLVVEDAEITAVFDGKAELDALLKRIREHATSFVFDPQKPGERDACRSLAYKVARSKTAIDGKGKEIVADIKKKAATIDAMRKAARDDLDALKKEVLAPVTAWEARQAEIDDALNDIVELREVLIHEDAAKIEKRLQALENHKHFDFDHKQHEAEKEIAASRQVICNALEKRKQYDAEQAELARLRADAAGKRANPGADGTADDPFDAVTPRVLALRHRFRFGLRHSFGGLGLGFGFQTISHITAALARPRHTFLVSALLLRRSALRRIAIRVTR